MAKMIDFKENGEDNPKFYSLFNKAIGNATLYELEMLSSQYYEDILEFVSWIQV